MSFFFKTMESIPEGVGFPIFGVVHWMWLSIFIVVTVFCCLWYPKLQPEGKERWKTWVVVLLVADELFKLSVLLIAKGYLWGYLPLHLCSINLFLILWYRFRPSALLGNFLYAVCIPGALAALLFPAWSSLPLANALHIHSFTAHILLALYPVVLTAAGEIQPDIRKLPLCVLLLLVLAALVYGVNRLLNTNFMFLMYAPFGNPLCWFERNWGNHLYGFPVIAAGVFAAMYLPIILHNYRNKHKKIPKIQ